MLSFGASVSGGGAWISTFGARTSLTIDLFNLFKRTVNDIEYFYQSRLTGDAPQGVGEGQLPAAIPRSMQVRLNRNF